jgi:hypothetical protein
VLAKTGSLEAALPTTACGSKYNILKGLRF